jgi:lysozyme
MDTAETTIDFIAKFEGLKLTAYRDVGGVLTIGYGHTGKDVLPNMVITTLQARILLEEDIAQTQKYINHYVKVPLNANQFMALTSLVFNIGIGDFERSSLLKYLNAKKYSEAANCFVKLGNVDGTPNSALILRRISERKIFQT